MVCACVLNILVSFPWMFTFVCFAFNFQEHKQCIKNTFVWMWGVCDTSFHYMFLDLELTEERAHNFLILLATSKLFSSIWVLVHSPPAPATSFYTSLITREVEYGYISYMSLWIMYMLVQAEVPLGRGGSLFPITVLTHPPCIHAWYCFLILFLHPEQLFWTHLLLFHRPVPCVWGRR